MLGMCFVQRPAWIRNASPEVGSNTSLRRLSAYQQAIAVLDEVILWSNSCGLVSPTVPDDEIGNAAQGDINECGAWRESL
jgi:hypothetical protein